MPADINPQDAVSILARLIYIHLASDAISFVDSSAKLAATPESMAKLSFKLAESFHKIESERSAAASPGAGAFDVGTLDFHDIMSTKPAA